MPANIIPIPIADLVTDSVLELSGRTKAEREANAKLLVPSLKQGWQEEQPGQVFKRDGKWHVAAGFTRVYAIRELLEDKKATGYFVEIPDDRAKLRTIAIRSNSGQDISNLAKGRIYIQMRDGDDPTKLAKGEVCLPSMTLAEIADEVGKTPQGVAYCVHLAESPEEIQTLMGDNEKESRVNGNVVDRARQMATDKKTKECDEKLWIKAVKKAIAHAEANGKKSAAMPDFDAIKAEIFPERVAKLKAVTNGKPVVTVTNHPPEEKDETEEEADANEPKEDKGPKGGSGGQSALELGSEAPKSEHKSGDWHKKQRQDKIDAFTVLLRAADDEYARPKENKDDDGQGIGMADEEIEHLAAFLVDKGAIIATSPI